MPPFFRSLDYRIELEEKIGGKMRLSGEMNKRIGIQIFTILLIGFALALPYQNCGQEHKQSGAPSGSGDFYGGMMPQSKINAKRDGAPTSSEPDQWLTPAQDRISYSNLVIDWLNKSVDQLGKIEVDFNGDLIQGSIVEVADQTFELGGAFCSNGLKFLTMRWSRSGKIFSVQVDPQYSPIGSLNSGPFEIQQSVGNESETALHIVSSAVTGDSASYGFSFNLSSDGEGELKFSGVREVIMDAPVVVTLNEYIMGRAYSESVNDYVGYSMMPEYDCSDSFVEESPVWCFGGDTSDGSIYSTDQLLEAVERLADINISGDEEIIGVTLDATLECQ
jgi:hypothetical protein